MRGRIGDKARLDHIFEAIQEIETYVSNFEKEAFMQNSMMKFACIKQMEIIGEASNHLSIDIKNQFPNIEWKQIIGLRNIFVHEYFGIDSELLWDIIKNDLPGLKEKMVEILHSME